MNFPVDGVKPEIFSALQRGVCNFVVSAPTGSGKSTRLPTMFADWLERCGGENKRVIVLQPRRIAARMLAKSVAKLSNLREKVDVGWHVRFDKCYDTTARIVFLTEGILARMILSDPDLHGVGAIIFDEFHERSIYADISLALALRVKNTRRRDLIIAACSASMDSLALSDYLGAQNGECVSVECGTRNFPVDIQYVPNSRDGEIWNLAAREFARLSSVSISGRNDGNFLIFMPGAYEIGRTVSAILRLPESRGFEVCSLHGDLSPAMQDKIVFTSTRRKVIVSTNVAETSLTIEGVDTVIDSGLARVARYDDARGVNTLLTEHASLASAAQRAGRAGRLRAGRAVRLWKKSDEEYYPRYNDSEITRVDLSQFLLWLKSAGLDFGSLELFEKPSDGAINRAERTLESLGALSNENITKLGRDMARIPAEPRFARLLIEGAKRGCFREAALVSAMSEIGRIEMSADSYVERDRDELVGDASSELSRFVRLCEIAKANSFDENFCRKIGIYSAGARRAWRLADDYARLCRNFLDNNNSNFSEDELAKCVLSAFSDRVGMRLNLGTYACRLVGGGRGELRASSAKYVKSLFVALELREQKKAKESVAVLVSGVCPISSAFLQELFPKDFSISSVCDFDESVKAVVSREFVKFRDLPVSSKVSDKVDDSAAAGILRDEILSGRIKLKNFGDAEKYFIERVNFASKVCPELGIVPIDEAALSSIFEQMCLGLRTGSDVKNSNIMQALRDWLSPEQAGALKAYVPTGVEINPSRRPVSIVYDAANKRAVVSALFKDLFSFNGSSLKICGGRILPTYEILSPGHRVVQTTQNLDEFWKTSWTQVRKELKARYPKHFKPTDPW